MCLSGWNLKAAWKCLIMSRFVKHIHIPNKKIHPIRNDIWNNKRHQGRGQLVSVSDNISCRPTSRSIWLSVTNALGLNEWWKINRRSNGGEIIKKEEKVFLCLEAQRLLNFYHRWVFSPFVQLASSSIIIIIASGSVPNARHIIPLLLSTKGWKHQLLGQELHNFRWLLICQINFFKTSSSSSSSLPSIENVF